ncbi:hypothetical protein NCS52_00583500 [Fusarium sp. LHS14.1]|nr:hypothetical protein NCS52_00583500 [Fusarium sp. LHS14.1]
MYLRAGFGKYDFMYLPAGFGKYDIMYLRIADLSNDCNVGDGWEGYPTDEMDVTPSTYAKTTRRCPEREMTPSHSAAVKVVATIAEAAQQQLLSSGSSPEEMPAPIDLRTHDGKYDFMYSGVGFASTTSYTCEPTSRMIAMSGAVAA